MRTIFIADAHLDSADDKNYRMLCQFLHGLVGNTQSLYIMGDLFDFWLGFKSKSFIASHEPVLQALRALVDSGCRLVYFEGNHDFHLGDFFRIELKTQIYRKAAVLNIQGKQLYLCHGDQINSADYGYRLLRSILHNRVAEYLVTIIPPSFAMKVRTMLQKQSRAGYESKKARWDYGEIIRNGAKKLQHLDIDGMITGHFHLPIIETIPDSNFTILSLGDWMEHFSYGEMENGKLTLKYYCES